MQSLRASSALVSRAVASTRGRRGWSVFLITTVAPTTVMTLCDDGNNNDKQPEIFSKDSQGNIDWGKTVSRIPQGAFWDDVARSTGSSVRYTPHNGTRRIRFRQRLTHSLSLATL